jgi:hypothetical protein
VRGDLDLHIHRSIPPLSEGNLVDLDLGVLGVVGGLPPGRAKMMCYEQLRSNRIKERRAG